MQKPKSSSVKQHYRPQRTVEVRKSGFQSNNKRHQLRCSGPKGEPSQRNSKLSILGDSDKRHKKISKAKSDVSAGEAFIVFQQPKYQPAWRFQQTHMQAYREKVRGIYRPPLMLQSDQ